MERKVSAMILVVPLFIYSPMNVDIFYLAAIHKRELHLNLLLRPQVDAHQWIQLSVLGNQFGVHRWPLSLRTIVVVANERSFGVFAFLEPDSAASVEDVDVGQSSDDKLPSLMLRRITFCPQRPVLNAQILQRWKFAQSIDVSP
jgi:hypothetical protein